jgi:head-tail adaptor
MGNLIDIQERTLMPPMPGQLEGQEVFATVKQVWAAIETPTRGSEQFNNVNIADVHTHIFYIRFDPELTIETGNTFIHFDGRRFRVISAKNDNELGNMTVIMARETGLDSAEAARA